MPEKKDKQTIIVIKKITVARSGAHGGSWKVAFADFMTAMMCFFLVMWLITQPEEVRKQVAKYFSGPTIIEQQLNAYGAELTLEKLFLDLTNEPLKAFQAFLEPADLTPDLLSLGSKKVVLFHVANALGDIAKNVEINKDEITFDIPENYLFEKYSAIPAAQFVAIAEKLKTLTTGLESSNIDVRSTILAKGYPEEKRGAIDDIAHKRLDLVANQIKSSLEHDSNTVHADINVSEKTWTAGTPSGFIHFSLKQKDTLADGRKPRELKGLLEGKKSDTSVYDEFVRRMSESNKKKR